MQNSIYFLPFTLLIMENHAILAEVATRIPNDVNGNPRYAIHFLSLGLTEYPDKTPKRLTALGLRRYHNKSYGGGYSFKSYNLQASLDFFHSKLNQEKESQN